MKATTSGSARGVSVNISVRFVFNSPRALAIKHAGTPRLADVSSDCDAVELERILPPLSSLTGDGHRWWSQPGMANGKTHRGSGDMPGRLTEIEFQLDAPLARSVKLAADFTDWDRFPVEMTQSTEGIWWTSVPLLPGRYSYRFIVDGQWCDDPQNIRRAANPFGTSNAVVQVT